MPIHKNAVIAVLMETDIAIHRAARTYLPPADRHSFGQLVGVWSRAFEGWAAQRLPETVTEEA